MRRNDANRVKKVVEDEKGDLVVSIERFTWLNCLIHSVFGYLSIAFFAVGVFLLVTGYWIWAMALGGLGLVSWVSAWLYSNDNLKERIYIELLESHLLEKKLIAAPFISARFYTDKDVISCITGDGEKKGYKVEFMQERKSTYAKIHTEGKAC